MGLLNRRRTTGTQEPTGAPRAVLAAAMPLVGPGVAAARSSRKRSGVEAWQKDAWYFYDSVGELRGPVQRIANAISKADLYAAEIDQETGKIAGPTDNAQAQAAAAQAFGGQGRRAQLQETIAIHWQIPGESYIVIRPVPPKDGVPQPDAWLVLSAEELTPKGGTWEYIDPLTFQVIRLGGNDRLIRVWKPHPRQHAFADSAVRPALIPLREIEKTSQNLAARLDSRLAGNGLLLLPQEMDFPQGDAESQAQAIMLFIMEAMEASLSAPGQSSAQVPIVLQMKGELISQVQHLDLATAMDDVVTALRQDALSRLAAALDMPKPVAEGTETESNHWSAWLISEDTSQLFVEPLLERIADAVTEHWFRPALRAMGVADPDRYVLAWDLSEVVKRPGETEDLNWLYENGLISDDYRRAQSGIPDDAIPDDEELNLRRLERVVLGAPTLAADPQVSEALFGFELAPAAAGVSEAEITGEAPALEPAPPANPQALPETEDDVPDGLVAAAELLVFDALSRAGGRLLTREYRGQFSSTPRHELHTVIACADTARVLEGSFQFSDRVADAFGLDRVRFRTTVSAYVENRIVSGERHNRDLLSAALGMLR